MLFLYAFTFSLDPNQGMHVFDRNVMCILSANGNVIWTPRAIIESSCDVCGTFENILHDIFVP